MRHIYKVIKEPDPLDVGVAFSVHSEQHTRDDKTWWYIYSQYHTWMGFDENIQIDFDPIYLEGTVEGLNQTVKMEIVSEEGVAAVVEVYIPLVEVCAKALVDVLRAKTMLELAKQL